VFVWCVRLCVHMGITGGWMDGWMDVKVECAYSVNALAGMDMCLTVVHVFVCKV